MKKLLVILAALLITVTTFAQVPALKTVKKGSPIQIGNQPAQTMSQQKNGNASFWFEFTTALENYWGEELEGFGPPIQCDFRGLYPFPNGNTPVQFMSLGQVFDWNYSCWDYFYNGQEIYSDVMVPYLAESNSYSIDSVKLCFSYKRGTNVDASVVDTLAFSYILNMDNEQVHTLSSSSGPAFSMLYVPYNESIYMADYASLDNSVTLTSTANIVYDKIPLTVDDVTDSTYFYYVTIPTPAGLTGITGKKMAVTFTFIPGNDDRTAASIIGTDLNTFRTLMSDDPRENYNNWGTTEMLEDVNGGLFTDSSSFDPSDGWYGAYNPNCFWIGNPHPYLGLKITCNDCAIVNVKDMETKNITVSPNPATNNIKVNLAGEGKANVQLFNLVGQLVYSETATTNTTINVADLHSGIYMLKVSQNGKVYTSKVVVK